MGRDSNKFTNKGSSGLLGTVLCMEIVVTDIGSRIHIENTLNTANKSSSVTFVSDSDSDLN